MCNVTQYSLATLTFNRESNINLSLCCNCFFRVATSFLKLAIMLSLSNKEFEICLTRVAESAVGS